MARSLKDYMIWMLSRRDYSRVELATKSQRKFRDLPESDIMQTLDALTDLGWQSDDRFARSFFRQRVQQGKGLKLIRYELAIKGISEDILNETIQEADVDWVVLASHQIRKKYPQSDLDDRLLQSKIFQFLARRGFTSREIEQSLQNLRCD